MLAVLLALLISPAGFALDAVLARYTAGEAGRRAPAGVVEVEIEASLPHRAERGRVLAIRHGAASYDVIRSEGDQTVKRQVIARYLAAAARGGAMEASAVAVTPDNYKFRLVGSVESGGTLSYVFDIVPRKKRVGLMEGQIWIDAATGIAVREYGRMVKSPSVFLRRIEVLRDTSIRNGAPYLRITRLMIDTRVAGPAELTIRESPQ